MTGNQRTASGELVLTKELVVRTTISALIAAGTVLVGVALWWSSNEAKIAKLTIDVTEHQQTIDVLQKHVAWQKCRNGELKTALSAVLTAVDILTARVASGSVDIRTGMDAKFALDANLIANTNCGLDP